MGTRAYTLVICATITVNPSSLPSTFGGVDYNQTLTATGGTAPYSFAVTSGSLPGGLSLASSGELTGTPNTSGSFNFTITATDVNGCTGSRSYTLIVNICPTITVNPASLPSGLVGASYSQTVVATGGVTPYIYSVSSGTLPPGLTLASNGSLSGTPTTGGAYSFTVKAADVNGCAATRAYTLTICSTIAVNPVALPEGYATVPYNQALTATGGVSPYTFAVTSGSLPSGLTLSSGGELSGAPTAFGTFNFTVTATDNLGCTGARSYTLIINNCAAITLNPASLPDSSVGAGYDQTITAGGGALPYNFIISAGTLPPGLTLASGGALTGVPTASGSFTFTVKATDVNGCMGTRSYTVIVCATIVINPASLPGGFVGAAYSQTITAVGGTAHTFAVTAGALPAGLSLSAGGVLSGVPTASGTSNFTITATDSLGCTGSRSYTVFIGEGLQYYPLPFPVRLLDTRPGQTACYAPAAALTANGVRLQPAQGNCNGVTIPSSAKAIAGNATVVNFNSAGGFITLFPSDAVQPNASNLNFTLNQIVPNSFTVKLGDDGAFKIFSSAATHFIVDITGYYAPPGQGGLYYHPLPSPLRLLDTRSGQTACDAPETPLGNNGTKTVTAHRTCQGATIPASAKAIVGNATVVNAPALSSGDRYITLYPFGATQPNASNLNFTGNQIVPNAFVTGLSNDGKFNIFSSGSTEFIVDVAGYFSDEQVDANGVGLLYNPLPTPVRLLDTRPGQTGCDAPEAPLGDDATRTQSSHRTCFGVTILNTAKAVVGNGTVVNFISSGFNWITLYPFGATEPNASNLNFTSNQIVPNAFVVGLSNDGKFNIYSRASTHFIVDLTGYFAP
jgi:hypothetical protein